MITCDAVKNGELCEERASYFYVNFGYCKVCMTALFDATGQA